MSQNLQNFVKFQKFQLENLVDFEKCCKTHIFLQKSEPIQPKTSNIDHAALVLVELLQNLVELIAVLFRESGVQQPSLHLWSTWRAGLAVHDLEDGDHCRIRGNFAGAPALHLLARSEENFQEMFEPSQNVHL